MNSSPYPIPARVLECRGDSRDRNGLVAVPETICLIKEYCEVILSVKYVSTNPSDSVIQAVVN